MAYISQEEKKVIAEKLKVALKGTGIKYSLGITHYSTLYMTITQSPIDFMGAYVKRRDPFTDTTPPTPTYAQLNNQYCCESFTGEARTILETIIEILYSSDWYDRSDSQSDYFDTAYYVYLNIGTWDKPYKVSVN